MSKIDGKKIVFLSLFGGIVFGWLLPKLTSIGVAADNPDKTNYLSLCATILAVFGIAKGLEAFPKNKWLDYLRKLLAAILIIPAGAFFITTIIVRSFNMQPTYEPFSYISAGVFLLSLVLGLLVAKSIRNGK